MLCFTGDMHGEFARFSDREVKKLKKTDTLIVCGDFGFLWSSDEKEKKLLKKIGKRKHKTLFVPGANENYDLLESYPAEDLFGGKARHIEGNLYCLMTGQVYEIDGKKVLCFAGGEDVDAEIAGKTLQEGQLPDPELLKESLDRVLENGGEVDCIVSYEPPFKMAQFINLDRHLDDSFYPCFLDEVSKKVTFSCWYFGKYHRDKMIPPRYQAVFTKYYSL